jgi:DNA-binding response OmpR family regulator
VLVVDDDPDVHELFESFLKKIGFSRVVVGTAKEAIGSLRKQKFGLMFLDLQLPAPTEFSGCIGKDSSQVVVTAENVIHFLLEHHPHVV